PLHCFFFQAEDGIRDFHVTGVQTCALPICQTEQVEQLAAVSEELAASIGEVSSRVDQVSEAAREAMEQVRFGSERIAGALEGMEIGRASCREGVVIQAHAVSLTKRRLRDNI